MTYKLFAVALAVATYSTQLFAQAPCQGAKLGGVVHDSSDYLLPGTTLLLDGSRSTQSGADGRFSFPCTASGSHHLSVSMPGFASSELTVQMSQPTELNLTLAPESIETTIEVDADAADVTPSPNAAGPSQTIAGKRLQELADDPDDLLRQLQQIAAASGGNPANAIIAVDGFQDSSALPPKSSIAYIKVNPDLFSSEYREPPFGGGGRVEIYTKPGQKAFHGALFTTNGSSWENARDPFSTAKGALGKQRYGFELAGPIRKAGSDFAATLEYRRVDNVAVINAVQLNSAGAQVTISGTVPTPQRLWLPTARVDWQIGAKNTLIASYTGTVNSRLNLGVGGTTLAEASYNANIYDQTVRLTDVTTVSAHLMHETRASLRFFGETDTPASSAPQIQVSGAFTGGGASVGNLHYNRMRLEVDDDFILTSAHHTVKGGTQFFLNNDHRNLTNNFNGTYVFSNLAQYRSGTPYSFTGVTGNPRVDFVQINNALFIQDDWKLAHGVMISSGLRYYIQDNPFVHNGLTPRIGIQWAPGKNPHWTLHAHAGLFADQIIPNEYAEVLREDGVNRITSSVYSPVYGDPISAGATVIHTQRTYAQPLANTSFGLWNVGGTRDLPLGFNLSVDLGQGRIWNNIRSRNINAPTDGTLTGPRPMQPNLNILQVQNSGQGRLNFEFVGLQNFKSKRLGVFFGAVHIDQIDNTDDNEFTTPQNSYSDAGEFARRSDSAPWQIFSNFTMQIPGNFQISGNLNANGRRPFNITTGIDNNGDGDFNDRPQIAAPGTPGALQTRYGLLVASGGVAVLGRNRGSMPWNTYLDANLQRSFKITRDARSEHQQTLTANIRSSNLLNHTNVTAVGGIFNSPLFDIPYAADNGRRIEAGLRYSF